MEMPVEECIGYIKLFGRPSARCGDGEDSANRGGLHHRCEGLAETNTGALSEAPHHPAGFVALQGPVRIQFVLEHPFAGDNVRAGRPINEPPGTIALEGVKLERHRGSLRAA